MTPPEQSDEQAARGAAQLVIQSCAHIAYACEPCISAALTAHAAEARRVALEEAAEIATDLSRRYNITAHPSRPKATKAEAETWRVLVGVKSAIRALLDEPRREDGDGG